MDIHVVQSGDTIASIAEQYGVSAQKIISDNEITTPDSLVTGQTIVIVYPEKTYIVQEGDTLNDIAVNNNITLMQLLRNNSFLAEREYIYPGETLVISYANTKGKLHTGGFAYPYINRNILYKTLPYLTYLTIYNYTVTSDGTLVSYYDDIEIIQIAKDYGVAPLMLLTTTTTVGVPNIEAAYEILLNEGLQEHYFNIILDQVKSKGYYGVNLAFQYLTKTNRNLYMNMYNRIAEKARTEGIPIFITINPNKSYDENQIVYEEVDLSFIDDATSSVSFLTFNYAFNFGPPAPVGSIVDMNNLISYVLKYITSEKINIGYPVYGYDWELPYIAGYSAGSAITLESILNFANSIGSAIEFDEVSQTPFLRYTESSDGIQHIIWFIDARSINALLNLVDENRLKGTGFWNIMNYNPQLWLLINTQYEIETVL